MRDRLIRAAVLTTVAGAALAVPFTAVPAGAATRASWSDSGQNVLCDIGTVSPDCTDARAECSAEGRRLADQSTVILGYPCREADQNPFGDPGSLQLWLSIT